MAYSFSRVTSLIGATTSINGIITQIENAINNSVSKSAINSNQMSTNLDMNSNRVYNLPAAITNHEPARLSDLNSILAVTQGSIPTGGGVIPAAAIGGLAASATSDTTNAVNITSGLLPVARLGTFIATANVWSGIQTFGPGTYAPTPNYTGGTTNSKLLVLLGSTGSPVTTPDAIAIFQKSTNYTTPGLNHTIYGAANKYSTTANTSATVAFFEAVDRVGGTSSFVEGLRSHGGVFAGTLGSGYGHVSVAWSTAPASSIQYLIGEEASVILQVGSDASTFSSFNPNAFTSSYVASSQGTKKIDAAFVTNFYNTAPARTGILILGDDGAGHISIDDTGFATRYKLNVGIDLSVGTYNNAALKFPNGQIDPVGAFTAPKITSTGAVASPVPVTVTAATYTVSATDVDIIFNTSATCVVTLPTPASNAGRILRMKTIAAQAINSASANVSPLSSATPGTAMLIASVGKWLIAKCDGISWVITAAN